MNLCPPDFEMILYPWLGLNAGNIIDGEIVPVAEEGDDATIFEAPPVDQTIFADDWMISLCGKRSGPSYVEATRVEFNDDTGTFECPSGL